ANAGKKRVLANVRGGGCFNRQMWVITARNRSVAAFGLLLTCYHETVIWSNPTVVMSKSFKGIPVVTGSKVVKPNGTRAIKNGMKASSKSNAVPIGRKPNW